MKKRNNFLKNIYNSLIYLVNKALTPFKYIVELLSPYKNTNYEINPDNSDLAAYNKYLSYNSNKYKVISFVSIVMMVFLLMPQKFKKVLHLTSKPYIAKIKIHGSISMDKFNSKGFNEEVIKKIIKDKKVISVIVDIDSGGGGVADSEALYKSLRKLSEHKNTIAVVQSIAASGAYLAALGCNSIISYENSTIGSIGVISHGYEMVDLAKKLGINFAIYKSSPYKASPNRYEKTSPLIEKHMFEILEAHMNWFKGIVKERRGLKDFELKKVANGKVFTGAQALKLKLIDGIGDEEGLIEHMKKEGIVQKNVKVIEITAPSQPNNMNKNRSSVLGSIIGLFKTQSGDNEYLNKVAKFE